MVIIDSCVYRKLDDYVAYIVRENQCSRDRAKQKILDIARERNIPVYQMCLNSTTYTLVSREFKQ